MASAADPNALDAILGPLDGARILGGCDNCDAYQEVRKVSGQIYRITVRHDSWCPFLAKYEGRAS